MVRKSLLIVLLLIFAVSLFIGCGKKSNSDNGNALEDNNAVSQSPSGSDDKTNETTDGESNETVGGETNETVGGEIDETVGDEIDEAVGDEIDEAVGGESNETVGGESNDATEDLSEKPNETPAGGSENENNTVENIPIGNKVGNRFKDLTLQTLDGTSIDTADLRNYIFDYPNRHCRAYCRNLLSQV